jgi:hypothetical protein
MPKGKADEKHIWRGKKPARNKADEEQGRPGTKPTRK